MNEQKVTGKENGSQMRITDDERKLIKSVFYNNETLLKLMRKMFLPELDPQAPIGQMIDLYRTIPTKDRSPELVAVDLMARNLVIDHVDNILMQLDIISKLEPQTTDQVTARLKKDSAK